MRIEVDPLLQAAIRWAVVGAMVFTAFGCGGSGARATVTGAAGMAGAATTGGAGGGVGGAPTGGASGGGLAGAGAVDGGSPDGAIVSVCGGKCGDFPATPIIAGAATSSAATLFGSAGSGSPGGPCLVEPQDGTLFPNNWLRPRFSWVAPTGMDLFELRIHADNQTNDLVVYTTHTSWTMNDNDKNQPAAMWQALSADTQDQPIVVTIRGVASTGGTPYLGSSNTFTIAPVATAGKVVYWSPSGPTNGGGMSGQTTLYAFGAGDESVIPLLQPSNVTKADWETYNDTYFTNLRPVTCIGCHTATPDGAFISFNDFYPWGGVLASAQPGTSLGTSPGFMGTVGFQAIAQPWVGMTTYSAKHWSPGDHIAVAPLGTTTTMNDSDQQPGLAWFDLEATMFDPTKMTLGIITPQVLQGTGWDWIYPPEMGQYAAAPSWSHRPGNDFIVFTMTSNVMSGRMGTGSAHLYKVPYSKTAQQIPTPIPGDGSAVGYAQYYGTLSPDDALIVYDQIPFAVANQTHTDENTMDQCTGSNCGWSGMYMQPATELFVILVGGGTGTRLAANDPPDCPGQPTSPGIDNTIAKWSPQAATASNGNTYYWLVFSSWRLGMRDAYGDPVAQIFLTAVVKPDSGPITTTPAIYLRNQPTTVNNLMPAWDFFQ